MPQTFSSPTRRWLLLGALLAAVALLVSVAARRDRPAALVGGDVSACQRLKGEPARACYGREVGRELATVGDAGPKITLAAPADSTEVTFAEAQPLLCDLHARVGVVDAQVPSWLGWSEPVAQSAPRS